MNKRINDLVKVAKLQKKIQNKNIEQKYKKAGYEHSIREFHKPTIEKLEEFQTERKNEMNALTNKIEDLNNLINTSTTVSTPLALEDIEDVRKKKALYVETDTDLDGDFLKENNLPLISELIDAKPEEIDKIVKIIHNMSITLGNLKSQIKRGSEKVDQTSDEIEYGIKMLRLYRTKLRSLISARKSFKTTGSGIDLIKHLENLSYEIKDRKGLVSKKLYNETVDTSDAILKKGDITSDDVADYYDTYLTPNFRL
ncbi:hypothetical protein AVEN_262690-1 [Araneus ventricosus]|uniref:Uncharacterized protein n=1 Tax=Araneus ventricosus TaxID=182803 RepID=A0A4Y2HEV6_ARAVE|nr:hypothetical protein AVEN_262690-1 [Araneus ventricosus]